MVVNRKMRGSYVTAVCGITGADQEWGDQDAWQ